MRSGVIAMVMGACLGVAPARGETVFNPTTDIDAVGCLVLFERGSGHGPYDYTNPDHRKKYLPVVEKNHFSIDVQFLIKGDTSAYIWDDLVFIVKAFPNHHRALDTMVKHRAAGKPLPPGADRIECYFANAFNFRPGDSQIYLIYARYLTQVSDHAKALRVFKKHETMKPASLERDFSMGLLYFEMKQYDKAKALAKKVYSKHYPETALRDKLISVGQWDDTKPTLKK